jgi:hypothetical protein
MPEQLSVLKHNPLTVSLYNGLLESRTRNVEAYVFVATTGRSGSESLARIFAAADNAITLHEPSPIMFSDYTDASSKEAYFRRIFRSKKRIYIKRAAAGHRYYVETNHQFIKNFINFAIPEFRDKVRIIHMYRDPVAVASSFYSINSIPGRSGSGERYLLHPGEQDNRVDISDLLLSDPEFDHDFYRCLWYWYEIETRIREYKEKYPRIVWHDIQTQQLNDQASLEAMFESLGIKYDQVKLGRLVGSRANKKTSLKKRALAVEDATAMHDRLLAKMEMRYGKNFWR